MSIQQNSEDHADHIDDLQRALDYERGWHKAAAVVLEKVKLNDRSAIEILDYLASESRPIHFQIKGETK